MTFRAFTVRAREALSIAANRPVHWFVGPRSVMPDAGKTTSIIPFFRFFLNACQARVKVNLMSMNSDTPISGPN